MTEVNLVSWARPGNKVNPTTTSEGRCWLADQGNHQTKERDRGHSSRLARLDRRLVAKVTFRLI
ncbi:MAG TPA: hypothetical protein DCE44_03970 [Verrucomicrobiales bacterium]|nr:hypothetical protein [Verrucomicrobiales bacterium]